MQTNKVCSICHTLGHSKFYCKSKPIKQIARSPIKKTPLSQIRTPKKKHVKKPRKKAKDDAWDAFSIYIRTRDCLRFTGEPTEGMCVTCKRQYPFKKLQAGHFISGRGNAVLFDERLVYSQCIGCNGNPPYGKGGNYVEYFRFMLDEVGIEKIDEYRALKNTYKVYKIQDFNELELSYKEKTIGLLT